MINVSVQQRQSIAGRELLGVAEIGDGNPFHELHREKRPSRRRHAGVKHLGDVGVVHDGQSLLLGGEPGQHLLGIHPQFDELNGNLPLDRMRLLGDKNRAHAAAADFLDQFVFAGEHGTNRLAGNWVGDFRCQALDVAREVGVRANGGAVAAGQREQALVGKSAWSACDGIIALPTVTGITWAWDSSAMRTSSRTWSTGSFRRCFSISSQRGPMIDKDGRGARPTSLEADRGEWFAEGNAVDVPENVLVRKLVRERRTDSGDRVRAVVAAIRNENCSHDDLIGLGRRSGLRRFYARIEPIRIFGFHNRLPRIFRVALSLLRHRRTFESLETLLCHSILLSRYGSETS